MAAESERKRVSIIGSGNWGSVIARIVGANTKDHNDIFHEEVKMYVYEEDIDGKKLSEIINTQHENVKYLPGFSIPENVKAVPDIIECAKGADVLVFVVPHQFVKRTCQTMKGYLKENVIAISLIKGLDHTKTGLNLVSNVIRDALGLQEVSVLMGANLAGCRNADHGPILVKLFHTRYFKVKVVEDADTVELCGALKNAVAIGAGMVDALGYGDNTKAAIIRIGLKEMIDFAHRFYDGVKVETFYESCGVADLITTCYAGRNRRAGEEFVRSKKVANPDIVDCVKDADILVFNLPPMGLDHGKKGGLHLISSQIKEILEIPDVSVMMGANIADEVANEMFSESTIGSYSTKHGMIFKEMISQPYFKINVVKDVEAVEFCGAFKNCIALAAGIIDGLGYRNNTKAAVIRIGLEEAHEFSRAFLPGSKMATFFESCGIADFIVTCYGGKHRLAGEAFVKTGKPLHELESVVPELRFRKLPGPDTLDTVYKLIEARKLEHNCLTILTAFVYDFALAYFKFYSLSLLRVPLTKKLMNITKLVLLLLA
ncbi:hypothetical protein QZH41_006031 [Actinostola sp. cb2023]|nr:hypothetical protein QZH41_006031 [Actinostola sp. cb2023]